MAKYMSIWASPAFLYRTAARPIHPLPFAFDTRGGICFVTRYVDVYRKRVAKVPWALYHSLYTRGLLDRRHVYGESHHPFSFALIARVRDAILAKGKSPKETKVQAEGAGQVLQGNGRCTHCPHYFPRFSDLAQKSFYTVIQAEVPESWTENYASWFLWLPA